MRQMSIGFHEAALYEAAKDAIRQNLQDNGIEFVRLQFTDLFGFVKNVTIPAEELEHAWEGKLLFDGSSVSGFSSVEQSDMVLMPDPKTFSAFPWREEDAGIAYLYCDVYGTDGKPFEGCPRGILKRTLQEASELGYDLQVGPEGEFFLFRTDEFGRPLFDIHDEAGYFDPSPVDQGEEARRDILFTMKKLGYIIEASHHEVAPGQHEVDFRYGDALSIADKWMTFKQIVKSVARRHGLYATFLPKPFAGRNGNAMHCNQSLCGRNGNNVFFDPASPDGLSQIAKHYIGGLLTYATEFAAVANPTVNSYKRLLPGYEAPTNLAWSGCNRSALIRIPHSRGNGTRVELRNPDPTANPYLLFALMLQAGLEGIKRKIDPPPEVIGSIYDMSKEEREAAGIAAYPRDLQAALDAMRPSSLVRQALGDHSFHIFLEAKQAEWNSFAEQVHPWEIDRYWPKY